MLSCDLTSIAQLFRHPNHAASSQLSYNFLQRTHL